MAEETTTESPTSESGNAGNAHENVSSQQSLNDMGQTATNENESVSTGNEGQAKVHDVVYDPETFKKIINSLPNEVQQQAKALHKQLLADYTRKTQKVAEVRKAAEAYRAFEQDPHGTIQAVAKQLGYELTKPGQSNSAKNGWSPDSGEDPQTWHDVVGYISKSIENKFNDIINPVMNEFQSVKKHTIENQLAEIDPSWQTYEDSMKENLTKHPSLANDPSLLYRISVPADVLESRATQRALKRMEAKAKGSEISGSSTTTRKPKASDMPNQSLSFSQAVEFARKKLAEEGIRK